MKMHLGISVFALPFGLLLLARTALTSVPSTAPAHPPAKELTLDLGDKVSLKLIQVPAGKFLMGSPETEKYRDPDETQHEVTISKPFFMGITHVTVDQFAAFVKDSNYKTDAEKAGQSFGFEIKDGAFDLKVMPGLSWRHPGFPQQGNHPAVQLSWNDATAFCGWLSKRSGGAVVLPTEAQWEYACRAGSRTAYSWGDDPDDGKGWANCADQSLKIIIPNAPEEWSFFKWDDGFGFTAPVASLKPNTFGLYDMTGNAWQWCADHYAPFDKAAVTDPKGDDTGNLRIQRGGSWIVFPRYCRSASRFKEEPNVSDLDDGFRVVVNEEIKGINAIK